MGSGQQASVWDAPCVRPTQRCVSVRRFEDSGRRVGQRLWEGPTLRAARPPGSTAGLRGTAALVSVAVRLVRGKPLTSRVQGLPDRPTPHHHATCNPPPKPPRKPTCRKVGVPASCATAKAQARSARSVDLIRARDDPPPLGSSARAAAANSALAGWPRLAMECRRPGSVRRLQRPLTRLVADLWGRETV